MMIYYLFFGLFNEFIGRYGKMIMNDVELSILTLTQQVRTKAMENQ
jgi:hypothetical protein